VLCLVFRQLTSQKRQAFEISFTKTDSLFVYVFLYLFRFFIFFLFIYMFIYTFGHLQSLPLENDESEHDDQQTTADGNVFQALRLTSSLAKLSS
jgi:hypothetical protein